MSRMYVLSKPAILFYYNILGIDIKDIDFNTIETRVRYIEDLSPSALYENLPESSCEINTQMQLLFERLCTEFGYSEEGQLMKAFYYKSVIGILNTITALNLVPEENANYLLHFERLNSVLTHALTSINSLDINSLIRFFRLINNNDIKAILNEFMSMSPLLSLLTVLALKPTPDNEDYLIFEPDSSDISPEKLMDLASSAFDTKPNFKPNIGEFKRLSYRQSYDVTINE